MFLPPRRPQKPNQNQIMHKWSIYLGSDCSSEHIDSMQLPCKSESPKNDLTLELSKLLALCTCCGTSWHSIKVFENICSMSLIKRSPCKIWRSKKKNRRGKKLSSSYHSEKIATQTMGLLKIKKKTQKTNLKPNQPIKKHKLKQKTQNKTRPPS